MRDIVGDRYRVEQRLAAGGFGAIYRATDLLVGRQVALKVLHPELAGDARVVARFRREAAALATLKSPHTLTLYDVGESHDTLYLVMELLRGDSLHDVLAREGALSWRRVAHIARGVCSSLREAHDHGIVHRDLTPANIFLEVHALDADFVKVLDFGIAKVLAGSELDPCDLTLHGHMVGTFDYMAPEQMVGGECTPKGDVFTLGAVIYEMVTGRRPFGQPATPGAMLMAILSQKPVPLAGVPVELARMILRCLDRDPAARPDIAELDDMLASALDAARSRHATTPPYGVAKLALDADEPTDVEAPMPQPPAMFRPQPRAAIHGASRVTRPRGSAMPVQAEAALGPQPVVEPPILIDHDLENADTVLAPSARGSVAVMDIGAAIEAAIDDVLQSPFAHGTNVDALPVSPAPMPPAMQPAQPLPAPRARLASGTRKIVSSEASGAAKASEPRSAAVVLRSVAIAAGLFGVGFAAALVIASL
jgi:serine/threonine protein kinase